MSGAIVAIKLSTMILMFLITIIMGSIPLRSKSFKENQMVLSLSSAFSGGLFLAVGLLHIIPDAADSFDKYYTSTTTYNLAAESSDSSQQEPGESNTAECETVENHFPFHMLIVVLSFSLILMIEKIIGSKYHDALHHSHDHNHNHNHDHEHSKKDNYQVDLECNKGNQQVNSEQSQKSSKISPYKDVEKAKIEDSNNSPIISVQRSYENSCIQRADETQQNETMNKTSMQQDISPGTSMMMALKLNIENSSITDRIKDEICQMEPQRGVEQLMNQVNNRNQSSSQQKNEEIHRKQERKKDGDNEITPSQQRKVNLIHQASKEIDKMQKNKKVSLTPFIIQFAFGIHAILEGLAIGVQDTLSKCLTIALAVICHKWAEGLVIGLSFKKAGVPIKRATLMVAFQGIMNPIGLGIGWALCDAGDLVSGILVSISAGTFLYISTVEVIVEEFNMERYKIIKFMLFLVAIGFISSLWAIEQATGGE